MHRSWLWGGLIVCSAAGITACEEGSGSADPTGLTASPESVTWGSPDDTSPTVTNVVVESGRTYEVVEGGLTAGARRYVDRSYTFQAPVPATLQGLTFIRTANNDKNANPGDPTFLSFDVDRDVTVYVVHDDRASLPGWLAGGFTDTGLDLLDSDAYSGAFSVFAASFPAGTVNLGSNTPAGDPGLSMYTVLVEGGEAPPPDTQAPTVPANLSATAASSSAIDLAWDASTDDVGVAGYRVFRDGAQVADVGAPGWTDSGLAPSTTYAYEVVAYDAAGNVSAPSAPASATTDAEGGGQPQPTVTNVVVESGRTYEVVEGGLTAGARRYVDRSYTFQAPVPATLQGLTFIRTANNDKNANPGDPTFLSFDVDRDVTVYVVHDDRASLPGWLAGGFTDTGLDLLDSDAYSGAFSVFAASFPAGTVNLGSNTPAGDPGLSMYTVLVEGGEAPPPDTQAPTVPANLSATAASSSAIDLAWDASTDDVGVAGYRVFRDGAQVADVGAPGWTDTGLAPSTTYAYEVVAYDAAGNVSAPSAPASATTDAEADTQAPTVPTNLSATAASSSAIDLAWDASTDDVGVAGYRVHRSDETLVGDVSGTTFRDTGLAPGATWAYKVAAYDAAGNVSARSTGASATTDAEADTQAPTVPTNLTASAVSNSRIDLAWNASTDDVGVAGYRVFRDGAQVADVGAPGWTDTGLAPSTTYAYEVVAYDAAGNVSAPSAPTSATTDAEADTQAPTVPANLSATAASSSAIDLAWDASTDDVGVAGYRVFRDGAQVADVGAPGWTDSGLAPSTTYAYEVVAYDAAGNVSAPSAPASATTDAEADTQAPTVPTNLTASAVSSSRIDLAWNASTDDVGVAGYRVFRDGAQVADVGAPGWTDTGLAPSTTYAYEVVAYDAAGNVSAPSAPTSATTDAEADTQAPTVPANLSATAASSSAIDLAWDASTDDVGVAGYRVFRDGAQVADVGAPGWTDSGLAPSTTYAYEVVAYDAAGNVSAPSAPASATTDAEADTQAPTVPTNLTASAVSSSRIDLAWNASTDDVGVAGYRVFRDGAQVADVGAPGWADTGLAPSTTYAYEVVAYDAAGNVSAPSAPASATTGAPSGFPRAPYPASPVIAGYSLDWATHRRLAPGSDNFPVTWADDGHQYTSWGDGWGFALVSGKKGLGYSRIEGPADGYTAVDVFYGDVAHEGGEFDAKSFGTASVDGVLYSWISPRSDQYNWDWARLYRSLDHGATWSSTAVEFTRAQGVGIPGILQFGQDYSGARDGYVYNYFINIQDGTRLAVQRPGEIVLARVARGAILDPGAYEWFAGMSADQPTWTSDVAARVPVFQDPNGVGWNVSVIYNAGLDRYLLATEHDVSRVGYVGFFDAPEPWGPWTTFAYESGWPAGGQVQRSTFYWNFSPKWWSNAGRDFVLVFSGVGENDSWNTVRGSFTLW